MEHMTPAMKNARRTPSTKASGSRATCSKLDSAPIATIVATTMAVTMALLTMLAEFRVKDVNADTIPYLERSTALTIELLLGEPNRPVPRL